MKKLYKRLEDYWDIGEKPFLVMTYTIVSIMISVGMAILILSGIRTMMTVKGESDYESIFREEATSTVIIQDNQNDIYSMNIKSGSIQDLNLNGDYLISNEDYTAHYVVEVKTDKIVLTKLQLGTDETRISPQKVIDLKIDSNDDLEIKVNEKNLIVLNKTSNELIQVDIEEGLVVNCWELTSDVVDWELSKETLYYLDKELITGYDLINEEKILEMNGEGLDGISINNTAITLIENMEEMAFVTQYNVTTRELLNGFAYEAEQMGIISAVSVEPYIYFYLQNKQGGVSVEIEDIRDGERYTVEMNPRQVKGQLIFLKGYGYYINYSDEGVIFSPSGTEEIYSIGKGVKSFVPLY